jgi:hypothetical protein
LGRTDTLSALQDLGIAVLDAEGNVRSAVPLFQDLAVELNELGLKSEAAGEIIQKVAGVRQRDILISLVEDLNQEQSQFASALEKSAGAAGKLDEKNNSLNNTLEALINNLVVGGQQLSSVLGEVGFADAAKDILRLFSNAVTGITDLLQGDSIGSKFAKGLVSGIGGVLTGPGLALIGAIFTKLFIDLAKFGTTSLKQILGINRAAEQQRTLQQSVLQTLLQNENIQREILALEGNKVAQEQLLLRIYNDQAAALARIQKAAATVTPGLFRGGFRGGERGVTRRGASGYIAAEAGDVSRGVGGATPGSRVVSIPNFAFGRGKRGTMVANTSEYYIPNYSSGGDAIFNKDMVRTMGLPSGARKINASRGYVPNFAEGPVVKDSRFALITPKKNTGQFGVGKSKSGRSYQFQILGYNDAKIKGRETANYINDVSKFGVNLANLEAKQITGGRPAAGKIAKLGNAGSISSLAGVIYEAAISAILKSPEYDLAQTATFDFVGAKARNDIAKIYPGLSTNARFIEAKISGNTRIFNSMANKMEAFGAGGKNISRFGLGELQKGRVAGPSRSAIRKEFGRSSTGYIPNFAGGLEDAIEREQEAGVPVNQIRINQSGKLRNSKNPKGLAVTNTRDEPTGRIPNFNRDIRLPRGDEPTGGGGALSAIFAAQAVAGLASGFIEAETTLSKFINGLSTGVTIFASLSLLEGPLNSVATKITSFGNSLAASGGALSGAGGALAGFGKALPGIGLGVSIAAAVAPLVLELTKTTTGFEELNEQLGQIDLKKISEGNQAEIQKVISTIDKELGNLALAEETRTTFGVEGSDPTEVFSNATSKILKDLGVTEGGARADQLTTFLNTALANPNIGAEGVEDLLNQPGIINRTTRQVSSTGSFDPRGMAASTAIAVQPEMLNLVETTVNFETLLRELSDTFKEVSKDLSDSGRQSIIDAGGTPLRREEALQQTRDFFQERGGAIDRAAARGSAQKGMESLTAGTEQEKTILEFEIKRNKILQDNLKGRNEALQALVQQALASEELSDVDQERLNTVLKGVVALDKANEGNTTAVQLAKLIKENLVDQGDEAQKISDKAVEITNSFEGQKKAALNVLKEEEKLAAVTAKRDDATKRIKNTLDVNLFTAKTDLQLAQEKFNLASKQQSVELKSGPVSPERARELEFEKESARILRDREAILKRTTEAQLNYNAAVDKAELDPKNVELINAEAQALRELNDAKREGGELTELLNQEEERANELKDQTGFQRGLETLDQGILNFGDQLGEAIPQRFSDNLGQGLKDAVSGAKDLDEALSDAGRNFLGFVRDAFLQQAADQFTSSLMGGKEGGGIFGGILGGAASAGQTAGQGAAAAEKSSGGGIGGFFSGLFGGKKGPQAGSSPSNPVYVSDVANAVGGGDPATKAIEELTGGAEGGGQTGFFAKMKDSFSNIFTELKGGFGDLFGGLKDTLGSAFKGLFGGGQGGGGGFFGNILGSIGGMFGFGGGGGFSLGGLFGFQKGGMVGFANGGPVGSTDTVPAMLSPGEFVVRRSAVDKYGTDFLSSLNRGLLPMQGFQNGGSVSPVASETGTGAGVGQVNNNSDFTFNIDQGGQVNQEGGEDSDRRQRDFAARVKEAVTTVVQEESRTGGTLNYLYSS